MPEPIPSRPLTWLTQLSRIMTDLESMLTDYDPDPDAGSWDEWVEMAMNEAWDALRGLDPDA